MQILTNITKDYNITLASQSPRRISLLKSLQIPFSIKPADIDENISPRLSPKKYCQNLAISKALAVAENGADDATIIIAADTIVVLGKKILNKPANKIEAFNMLKQLSNRSHFVYTGIALINTKNCRIISDYSRTAVYFRELSNKEIFDYVENGSTLDKAGSYGIQDDYGAVFVHRIEGCYNNVIGLPTELLYRKLIEIAEL